MLPFYNTSTFHNSHATLYTFVQLKIQTIVFSRAFSPESLPILIGPISSRFLMLTSNKNWLIVLFSHGTLHGTQTSSELCQQFPKSKSKCKQNPSENEQTRQPKNRGVPKSLLLNLGIEAWRGLRSSSQTNMFRCLSQSASTNGAPMLRRPHMLSEEENEKKVHVWAGRSKVLLQGE